MIIGRRFKIKIRKNLLITAISLFILSVALITGYFYFSRKNSSSMDKQISQVDLYIEGKEWDKAIKSLIKSSKNVKDRYSCYRVIKRSIEISEETSDFKVFNDVSKTFASLYSGNEDIQAYYVMSLLKTNQFDEAYKVANDLLISDEFKPLLAQSIIYYENKNSGMNSIVEYLKSRNDQTFFEYLATLLNERSLFINSALLWAKNGDIEKAYSMANKLDKKGIEEFITYITYDSGRLSETLVKLIDLPESDLKKYDNIMLTADLFYLKENYSRSRFYYEKAIELDVYESKPYMNISSIYLKMDDIKQAITYLNTGVIKFENKINENKLLIDDVIDSISNTVDFEEKDISKRLLEQIELELNQLKEEYKNLILLSYHLNKKINSKNAIKILEDFRSLFPQDIKIELLYLRENNNKINPEIFTSKLWNLLNKDVDNRDVSEFFVWYLLGIENYVDIELVLERSENRNPEKSWTNYYRGIIYGLSGDFTESLNRFNSSSSNINSWEILYNKGVIEFAMNNPSEALQLFNKSIVSINQLNYVNNRDFYLSKIKTKIGQVLISLNDIDEAIRLLNSAYELDNDNYTSDILKSVHLDLINSK